jgi:glycosyltransferase involved in cell wall biosynthesis
MTIVTNPLTSGYYAYLACIDSWRKVADDVVVVDGGSTDGSVQLLREWTNGDPKVRVLSSDLTHWGPGDRFSWPQIYVNRQAGHEAIETDWVIYVDADHVLSVSSAANLLPFLGAKRNELLLSFPVFHFSNGRYVCRKVNRDWIVNRRLASERGLPIGWGIAGKGNPLTDYPIHVARRERFTDPDLHIHKEFLVGDPVEATATVPIEVFRYGHFFFTPRQCLEKCGRLDRAVGRYLGRPARGRLALMLESGLVGIRRYMSPDELLSIEHPPEIRRVIERFYSPPMLGGALSARLAPVQRFAVRQLAHLEKVMRTAFARVRSHRRQETPS